MIENTSSYENDSDTNSESASARTFPTAHDDDLEELQRKFLYAIKACDIVTVKDLLEKRKRKQLDFDLNCKNYQGTNGLNLAIQVNCEQTIDLLVSQPGLQIGDSLMHAIRENLYSIVIKLLDILESKDPEKVKLGYEHSIEFPQHLTPLILAAQCGHYKIIGLLLKRGHTIPIPHKPQCFCKDVCKSLAQLNDGLGASELKLSVFRAITNPAYIAQTSEDPILTAFQLSQRLKDHGTVDRIFKSDYESLDFHTRMFAVHMIGLCRSSAEVELILTRQEGCNFFGSFPYHRLVMAMDLKQKEFVAHAYVQQNLETAWTGTWHEWKRYGSAYKSCMVFPRILQLLFIAALYLFVPYSKWGQHYALPVNRMLNYLASYTVFLAILTYENNFNKFASTRDRPNWTLKICIVVYATSFVVRAAKLIMLQGPKRYFSMLWNVYDCAMLIMLAAISGFWWLSYTRTWADDGGGAASEPVERKYWHPLDPTLVAEGLLAMVTVMSYMRLLFLCQLSYALGPMQVSLGKMTVDFARFAVLFGIIIVSFTAGLCRFYQYYGGMTRTDPATGLQVEQDESFVDVLSTLKTLFWGMFCMTSSTAGSVVIENAVADTETNEEFAVNNHYFTQAVGTALYSFFETLSVVVMLNMLIATMSNTFMRITGNSYIEWVFGRTQVFLSFSVHTELPPPLNLLPSVHCCVETSACLGKSYQGVANMMSTKGYLKQPYPKKEFVHLMRKLVKRYFRDRLSSAFVRKCNPVCS
ncbi:Transient receptor ion channel domain,Ion transport domain,Transient receptor potential channel [Cinara cedri]|uniref:Transient receptor ion channel domain,Ion transport domain,Transient receptor potential channel n=1 Tax=Cinara cedri TaxID=506608 RepID=A0A5E4M083_9HEMI|nr:Transient receptor ion channel domain,Ion transport domain,Transient receptor potential channel [Cinara cedri]